MPPAAPGVYEVYGSGDAAPIYIGQTLHLKRRVVDGLVMGRTLHQAGQKIRENEEPSNLSLRWAVTDRPAAAEEELYRRHMALWGRPPKYAGRR